MLLHQILNGNALGLLQQRQIALILVNLSNVSFLRLRDGLSAGLGDDLFEAGVLRVLAVVPRAFLRAQIGTNFVEHHVQDAVDGGPVRAVTVPECDEVGIEADGEGDAA